MQHLKPQSKHGTVMAVSMMKDEAPFLLEWFAHHLAVGFTDILVYTNDCSDGTDEMLIRLEELGLGYHRPNVIPEGIKPQPSALNHAQAEPLVRAADWVLVFDADEFLSINHPAGNLEGMLDDAVARGANGVVITWRIFGSGGVVDWSRAPVTEQYTRAAPPLWNKGWGVKTLFKFDPEYWKLGIHRPAIKSKHLEDGFPDTIKWLNGSGRPMEDYFRFRGWRSIRRTIGYDWAQMNHYAVKSVDAYAVRKFRGNVNNKKDKYNADYWSLQDRNEVEDRAILRHAPERARIMAELLKDPVLNKLHHAALERVEARLAEYRQTEAYEQLRDSLIAASKVPITDVEAKPPQARDPAKIAALMSAVEKKSSARPKEERRTETIAGWAVEGGEALIADWLQDHGLKQLLQSCVAWHRARLAALRDAPGYTMAIESLARAAAVPIHALDKLLFIQPLSPEGKRRVAALRAQGMDDAQIAQIVAQSVAQLEATRDAREAQELRALGFTPRAFG